jgi:hypothetical protein
LTVSTTSGHRRALFKQASARDLDRNVTRASLDDRRRFAGEHP